MLELRDLCFDAPSKHGSIGILNHIDLNVEDNKFLVVTGPNGGGKTTLARAIMGLVKPTAGQIIWNGEDITDRSITERAKLGISYGFQQPPRFKGMKVADLLKIAAGEPLGHDRCCEYLTKVGLCARDYVNRDVDASLSGGEVKRIEIATILARNGSLMIFDEPEAGIDLWSFSKLTETFTALHAEKKRTILIISHQERIIRLADEIILVAEGRVKARGGVDEIYPLIMRNTISTCDRMEGKKSC